MSLVLILAVLLVILVLIAVGVFLDLPFFQRFGLSGSSSQMRNIVASQREGTAYARAASQGAGATNVLKTAEQARVERIADSRLTLEKRLRFAQLNMLHPGLYYLSAVLISLFAFTLASLKFGIVLRVVALFTGPLFMRWLVTFFMDKRYNRFDSDYPAFLLSLVSLMKTGMNTMTALDTSSKGLDEESMVRQEVQLMNERLRYGVPEEKSVGSFGEDVYHPEIELFVQALLLSRRVGGNLSDTLERLAKQVRRRQYFRKSANAAIGMQRGSIWIILLIMMVMLVYLYVVYPEAITTAIGDESGWMLWQIGICAILLGIFWIRQVTKIKI